jgi:hypothetical protein
MPIPHEITSNENIIEEPKFNFDSTRNIIQRTIYFKNIVFCIQYQAPGVVWNHPNTGRGVYSQGVYVVKGSYTCAPMGTAPFEIKAKEWFNLEEFKDKASRDEAGPDGVAMIHFNTASGNTDYDIDFVGPDTEKNITTTDKRKFVICFEPGVEVNGLEIYNLKHVTIGKNSSATVKTNNTGRCVVVEKLDNDIDGPL